MLSSTLHQLCGLLRLLTPRLPWCINYSLSLRIIFPTPAWGFRNLFQSIWSWLWAENKNPSMMDGVESPFWWGSPLRAGAGSRWSGSGAHLLLTRSGGVIYLRCHTWQTQPAVLIALVADEAPSASSRAGGDAGGR